MAGLKTKTKKVTTAAARREMMKYADAVSTADVRNLVAKETQVKALFTHVSRLSQFADDFSWVFKMLRDYLSGKYKKVPWRTIALLAGALTYALMPLDLIPDFISIAGWTDDSLVVAIVLGSVKLDIENFKVWKLAQKRSHKPENT